MICTQDLWAIKSMLEDFKDYCTCEEAVGNLINEVEKEIDERDNIQKADRYREALKEIEGLVKNFCKDCDDYEDCNWDKEGCYYSLIPNLKNIINEAKGEGNG